jgi:hypothetical protein
LISSQAYSATAEAIECSIEFGSKVVSVSYGVDMASPFGARGRCFEVTGAF